MGWFGKKKEVVRETPEQYTERRMKAYEDYAKREKAAGREPTPEHRWEFKETPKTTKQPMTKKQATQKAKGTTFTEKGKETKESVLERNRRLRRESMRE